MFIPPPMRSQRGLYYYTVKISLNSNISRILSLAEVEVFGDYYNFDVSFGALFNLSKRTVNRIAFIQDGLTGKSTISDVTFVKKPVEPISVSTTCNFYRNLKCMLVMKGCLSSTISYIRVGH